MTDKKVLDERKVDLYVCPDSGEKCGADPSKWCVGCQCPAALKVDEACEVWFARQSIGAFAGVTADHVFTAFRHGVAFAASPDLLAALRELRYACSDKAEAMADAAIFKALGDGTV